MDQGMAGGIRVLLYVVGGIHYCPSYLSTVSTK